MKQFTDMDFDNEINSGTVVVDFYADWCSPCKMLMPTLQRMSSSSSAKFGKIDVDSNPTITKKYQINSLPTVLVFKDGNVVKKFTGLVTENNLNDAIKNA